MEKIINTNQVSKITTKLKKEKKKVVLAGGCFDLLHIGHILFLDAAKKEGDVLIVLLESDENTKIKKGKDRPINSQKNRSIVLSALKSVDYIIPLSGVTKNEEYDKLIVQIKPDIVAMTKGDKDFRRRKSQCEMIGCQLKFVIGNIDNQSTTNIISDIKN